jgi:hypothetical protein
LLCKYSFVIVFMVAACSYFLGITVAAWHSLAVAICDGGITGSKATGQSSKSVTDHKRGSK